MTSSNNNFHSNVYYEIHREVLQDEVPIMAYRNSIYHNKHLFNGKTVLDVDCGTGILSMLAAKAGAAKVIGIECSDIVENTKQIIEANQLSNVVTILKGKVEEVSLPDEIEKVDIIISEWMGYCLFYESKLDAVLFARDKWLCKDGILFPDKASLFICGIEDKEYKDENINLWNNLYDFDMSSLRKLAISEPLVDIINEEQVVTNACLIKEIDLFNVTKADLEFSSLFTLKARENDDVQALITFFKIEFTKCHKIIQFSTAPDEEYTHWKQTIFYFDKDITVKEGEEIYGIFSMKPNASNYTDLNFRIDIGFQGKLGKVLETNKYRMH
ncbi:hypothetical protein M0802_015549 [Mischocyttarus mexicanus]|nr:hypothetical protein M0802_015549 [Mischocyttarus mexicanus]